MRYAAAVSAETDRKYFVKVMIVEADSEKEAMGEALAAILELMPRSDGFYNHQVSIILIPEQEK